MKTTIVENSSAKALLALSGELDTAAVADFSQALEPLLAEEAEGKVITLDCSALEYISSAGMRAMLVLNKHTTAHGGKVVIAGLSEDIRQLFQMTGFDNMFELA